jgi:hypothetical protein
VRLNSLATTIGKVGLAVAGLVFGILVIRWVHIPTIYPYMLSLVIYVISLFIIIKNLKLKIQQFLSYIY